MKSGRLLLFSSLTVVLGVSALCQEQTVARLSRENRADVNRVDLPASTHTDSGGPSLRDSQTSRAAANALFSKSDLPGARALSDKALRRDPQDAEALFVRMELAGLEADDATALEAAIRLCETGVYASNDPRVRLAAVRVREAAANTPAFRAAVPRLQRLVANSRQAWPDLQLALLNAAMDGAPGLDAYALSRAAGILTDWRIVGPIGSRPLLDVDPPMISPADDLAQSSYAGRAVENFQFLNGWLELPDYFPRHGVFYATATFASFTTEIFQLNVESAGNLEIYIDGRQVLCTGAAAKREIATLESAPGPHRVLVKFAASAMPLRVAVFRDGRPARAPLRAKLSPGEATYLLAAEHYADGEFGAAVKQIVAAEAEAASAPLRFLRAQALDKSATAKKDSTESGQQPGVRVVPQPDDAHLIVDTSQEASFWASRLAQHPSCDVLQGAIAFYGSRGLRAERTAAQQRLDGCAPESLAYAHSLAHDGKHKEAAQALRRLLAGAPLDRDARLMEIRELQLAGDDQGAQRAAADWLRIAPNAQTYHRLAATADFDVDQQPNNGPEFYQPYRIDAAPIAGRVADQSAPAPAVVLLEDHVAIARPDGSVSLYVHIARRLSAADALSGSTVREIPRGAQVLTWRILHSNGTATDLPHEAADLSGSGVALSPGDAIDAEYVLHFTGDGGIPEHAEAFQFAFGSFDEPVLNACFVVLTPTDRGDGGVVIATGTPPALAASLRNGMLERVWEKNATGDTSLNSPAVAAAGLAIVRVVEQENGWSVPSNAEHQRRIETIHPGPRPEDS